MSKHSNILPPEPEKPLQKEVILDKTPVVRKPKAESLQRPAFETPLTTLVPIIAPSLKVAQSCDIKVVNDAKENTKIGVGTACKNSGCNVTYEGPHVDGTVCTHHPGAPIFHEGMKYWSCCKKKTTDFNTFLNQIGCKSGGHVWKKEENNDDTVECRWDYHQTGSHVVVAIYAKQYCPLASKVCLNPVRLCATLVFPQQENATFNMDMELTGVRRQFSFLLNYFT